MTDNALTTRRLLLRPLDPADARAFARLFGEDGLALLDLPGDAPGQRRGRLDHRFIDDGRDQELRAGLNRLGRVFCRQDRAGADDHVTAVEQQVRQAVVAVVRDAGIRVGAAKAPAGGHVLDGIELDSLPCHQLGWARPDGSTDAVATQSVRVPL